MRRLALKIALAAAAAAGAVGLAAVALTGVVSMGGVSATGLPENGFPANGFPSGVGPAGFAYLLYPLLAAVGAGVAAYAAARGLLAGRLERLGQGIEDIRREAEPARRDRSGDAVLQPGEDGVDVLLRRTDQAAHAVQRRIAELEKAEHYRRDYVGDVSHELKTPVFAIQGFAETLRDGALDDPTVSGEFIDKILRNTHRLGALVRNLADINRLESGGLKLSISPIDVGELLDEVGENLALAARSKQIDVRVDPVDGVPPAAGDRERIRQVIENLLDNAIKYTNSRGSVRMRAEAAGHGRVRISVADTGIGIAEDDLQRVTARFYRAEKSRSRDQGGTGLGLSIVKHILAAHGTSIEIASESGRGSTFSFTLPAADSPADLR